MFVFLKRKIKTWSEWRKYNECPKQHKTRSVFKCTLDGLIQWPLTIAAVCWRVLTFHLITLSNKYNYQKESMPTWMRGRQKQQGLKTNLFGEDNNCPVQKMPPEEPSIIRPHKTSHIIPPSYLRLVHIYRFDFVPILLLKLWLNESQPCVTKERERENLQLITGEAEDEEAGASCWNTLWMLARRDFTLKWASRCAWQNCSTYCVYPLFSCFIPL